MINSDTERQEEKKNQGALSGKDVVCALEADLIRTVSSWRRKGRTSHPDGAAHLGNSKHSGAAGTEGAWGELVTITARNTV